MRTPTVVENNRIKSSPRRQRSGRSESIRRKRKPSRRILDTHAHWTESARYSGHPELVFPRNLAYGVTAVWMCRPARTTCSLSDS